MIGRRAGDAWLVHPENALDQRSLLFAAGLAPDAHLTVVVIDIPDKTDETIIDEVARALPPGQSGLRLVFGRTPPGGAAPAGRRLAENLRRVVVTAVGRPWPAADGALFISCDRGPGWVMYGPSGEESGNGRRFPRPAWEPDLPDQPFSMSERFTAEPIAAGLWVRPAEETAATQKDRTLLMSRLRSRDDSVTVVLGASGQAAVPLDVVTRLWRGLPEHTRTSARFVGFGPVDGPPHRHVAEVLAEAVGAPVRWYNGLPSRSEGDAGGQVLAVHPDGSLGRPLLAREVVLLPPKASGSRRPPLVTDHDWPIGDLPVVSPGIHWYGPDTLMEVTVGGLWIRRADEPDHANALRTAPFDVHRERVMHDSHGITDAPDLRRLAEELAQRVAADRQVPVHVVQAPVRDGRPPGPVPSEGAPAAQPAAGTEPAGPDPEAPAEKGEHSSADRLRSAFGRQYEETAALVTSLLRQQPALLQGGPADAAAAELSALRLHLLTGWPTPRTAEATDASAFEPLSRLRARGWLRLPAFHGPVILRCSLDDSEMSWYAAQTDVVEPDWCGAAFSGPPGLEGNTDVLILSVRGRRTALLEIGDPDWVLFRPDTRFAVLSVQPGERNLLLLRELPPRAVTDPAADRRAARELRRSLLEWQRDGWTGVRRSAEPGPLFHPPGAGSRSDRMDGTPRRR
ncbi:hypothetical protein ABZ770_32220 [Streptomyces sp. NPDC006654]|uniref:hypothetical protein n=1 Tax=Streptomyces sp. NPDC006654 TaxID=3156897 RepID=UPI0033F02622